MEQELRKISKYCVVVILLLFVFWIYRLPHTEDYKYNERSFSAKIEVADSTLEILEIYLNQYEFGEKDYFISDPLNISCKVGFENGNKTIEEYSKTTYKKLSYYSFKEAVIYDAQLPQTVINEIDAEINKEKRKSRYFSYHYTIYSNGKIRLKVMEEFQCSENKGRKYMLIYSFEYQAKEIEMTNKLTTSIEKHISVPLARWNEISHLKCNWMVNINSPSNINIEAVESTDFLDYSDDKHVLIEGSTCLSETEVKPKTIPIYIKIETYNKSSGTVRLQIIKFGLDDIANSFYSLYKETDKNELSLICIQMDEDGFVREPIIIEQNNKKVTLSAKEIKEWL